MFFFDVCSVFTPVPSGSAQLEALLGEPSGRPDSQQQQPETSEGRPAGPHLRLLPDRPRLQHLHVQVNVPTGNCCPLRIGLHSSLKFSEDDIQTGNSGIQLSIIYNPSLKQ